MLICKTEDEHTSLAVQVSEIAAIMRTDATILIRFKGTAQLLELQRENGAVAKETFDSIAEAMAAA